MVNAEPRAVLILLNHPQPGEHTRNALRELHQARCFLPWEPQELGRAPGRMAEQRAEIVSRIILKMALAVPRIELTLMRIPVGDHILFAV